MTHSASNISKRTFRKLSPLKSDSNLQLGQEKAPPDSPNAK